MPVYDVSTLGTTTNQITFNDYLADPLYRVIRRTPTRRELREFDIPVPDTLGVADYQTLIGKEYLIIEGKMYPNDEASFDAGRRLLRKVTSVALAQEDSSSDQGYIPYEWTESDGGKRLNVKPMYVDIPEASRQGLIQPFRILLKIKYPVIHSTQSRSLALTIGTSATPTGGAQIPAVIPMNIGSSSTGTTSLPFTLPVVLGATAGSSSGTVENAGDFSAYPTITITGPISRPRITNSTTGEYIELDVVLASTGAGAIISYDQDGPVSIVANNVNAYSSLTSGSTLFKIRPGTVALSLSGASVGTGARATISFNDAWP